MKSNIIFSIFLGALVLIGCGKETDYQLTGDLPTKPDFSIVQVEGDSNRFVVTDLSTGNYNRVWEFKGGIPATSTKAVDTVLFTKKGTYDITLFVNALSGGGNAFNTQQVNILADVAGCQYAFMTDDCTKKCWRLSGNPGGVKVGPVPYSGEWYTSPNIAPEQADDLWCFDEDGIFEYNNNGASFSSCQGFIADPNYVIPPDLEWSLTNGTGFDELDRIEISGIWMGIEDSGPTYDIISVSDNEMVLLTPTKPCDGAPSNGWFTLTFISTQ